MKRVLCVATLLIVVLASVEIYAKAPEDQSHYLQKILLVVESPDTGLRLRYENALKNQAHLYTPRVDTLVSTPVMPGLKTLSNEKELATLAIDQKFDGVLVIKNPKIITHDVMVCPDTRGESAIVQAVDILTTRCPVVHLPQVTSDAHLYSVSPYQEIWRRDTSMETNAKDRKSPDKLFDEIAIEVFKDIQRHKLILPSKFQR